MDAAGGAGTQAGMQGLLRDDAPLGGYPHPEYLPQASGADRGGAGGERDRG
ncbi:hypothetical protein [Parabacteroides distasonis]|uniref:hypothetical protein n=1 Tax=Parabacteroides distasonis TaxID=823 RepID=UPI00232BBEF4|nr:hypothetical protein [Parabacteroides distasonis]MDB9152136.1 hypothetical protein [Parabacteroides distasonis]MDB9156691.1 hypothetical protein [Parabacteroides distasonis]MDB9165816.1 hypothetical protein [Parabacteroides distasonis]MDB9170224.1 hypothetical protein [Parabacteroides distasonis]MDB9196607.1 hypothetical protein [Parabacteroides distasonis]